MQLANSLNDDVFQGFGGRVDYPTLGLHQYDMLSTYGSLAGDLPPNFPAHCQPVWCRNICAKQTPHSTMRVPGGTGKRCVKWKMRSLRRSIR